MYRVRPVGDLGRGRGHVGGAQACTGQMLTSGAFLSHDLLTSEEARSEPGWQPESPEILPYSSPGPGLQTHDHAQRFTWVPGSEPGSSYLPSEPSPSSARFSSLSSSPFCFVWLLLVR